MFHEWHLSLGSADWRKQRGAGTRGGARRFRSVRVTAAGPVTFEAYVRMLEERTANLVVSQCGFSPLGLCIVHTQSGVCALSGSAGPVLRGWDKAEERTFQPSRFGTVQDLCSSICRSVNPSTDSCTALG